MKHTASAPRNAVLLQRLHGCKHGSVLLSALAVMQALLSVLFSLATKNVVNRAVRGEALRQWGLFLVLLAVAVPLFWGIRRLLSQRISDRTAMELRRCLLELLQRKQYSALHDFHGGILLERLQHDVVSIASEYLQIIPVAVGELAQLLGAMAVLLLIRAPLAVVVLACGCGLAVCGIILRHLLRSRYRAARKAEEELTAALQENLEQLELLRCAPSETVVDRVDRRQHPWFRARRDLVNFQLGGTTLFSLAVKLSTAALLLWGAFHIRAGTLLYGDLTAMLQLLALFQSPVTGLSGLQGELAAVDAAWDRMNALCDLPEEPALSPLPADITVQALCLRHVTFRYGKDEPPIFSDYSVTLPLDRWTKLSGVSGRGKSTLFRLILGLFRPESGEITVLTDRGEFPCGPSTRSLFAWVPQTPVLFSGTVRENLLLFAPHASDDALDAALKAAQCDFVDALPHGLDTVLGQFGEGISVGQRQRLAVARALLNPAKVLLLDEVTSALDPATAASLLDALRLRHPAALLATHRNDATENQLDQYSLEDDAL